MCTGCGSRPVIPVIGRKGGIIIDMPDGDRGVYASLCLSAINLQAIRRRRGESIVLTHDDRLGIVRCGIDISGEVEIVEIECTGNGITCRDAKRKSDESFAAVTIIGIGVPIEGL